MSVSPDRMIELVSKLPERHIVVVFRSAYDEYEEYHEVQVDAVNLDDLYLIFYLKCSGVRERVSIQVDDILALRVNVYGASVHMDDCYYAVYEYAFYKELYDIN